MVSRLRRRLDKLRLTLAILLLGFAINGTFETYTYINHSYPLPYAPSVFIIGPFVTLAGLLTLWIGRSDWDQPLSRRFRLAQEAFGLNVLALVLAITPVVWYGLWSDASIPSWVYGGFGAAIVVSLLFNFAIYVLVAYGLTANFGKALLLIAFGWASIVSIWTGRALAQELGTIVQIVQDRSLDFRPVSASISGIESYFALAYFMLMIAYLDAYHRSHLRTRKSS